MNRITRIAAAGAVVAALALPASQAFAASKTENALIGAAIGALAGTLLSHGDTGAVVAGAAVGGLVGASTGHDSRRSRVAYRTYPTAQTRYRYQPPVYRTGYDARSDYAYQNSYGYAVPAGYRGYGY
ncbi:MAG TPA: glycine zipper 2TM domain-containing protein [Caulobacteraceae bacterium]|jgi:osmotically inducible lipoprotein OsmB|nr:glycine zipper 2TM domain-containing protein [Caulobacteraceae bacterium]